MRASGRCDDDDALYTHMPAHSYSAASRARLHFASIAMRATLPPPYIDYRRCKPLAEAVKFSRLYSRLAML